MGTTLVMCSIEGGERARIFDENVLVHDDEVRKGLPDENTFYDYSMQQKSQLGIRVYRLIEWIGVQKTQELRLVPL